MALATTLATCLSSKNSHFDIIRHPYALGSMATAQAAHVPGDRLVKTVLLEDEAGYVVAVMPSTRLLDLGELCERTGRRLTMASEDEVREVFKDCVLGAIPPVGMAYGMRTYIDDSLLGQPEVYFEAGDHEELIHMTTEAFLELMSGAERGQFTRRMM
ncbi:aminoacyl-tRNA deacylase [Cupriavidus gilardii]|uniref:aminoacyl-tRNA deacylase n=1 Tax=Cupriavidus gilardii TaxID=82541 RepID=UPI0007E446FE|nr:YbaK/EbsC family protein [Cupriavidus gilardii]